MPVSSWALKGGRRNSPRRQSRHGSLAARKIRGRPRHGTEFGSGVCDKRLPFQIAKARHVSQTDFPTKPDTPRSSRPILIPKLRMQFADLPTLIYRLGALYLGDLLRIWVRNCAIPPRGTLLDFQVPRGRSEHRRNSRSKTHLPAKGFQGTRTLIPKRKLFPDLPTASPGHFFLGYPDEHSYEGPNGMRFRCRVPE